MRADPFAFRQPAGRWAGSPARLWGMEIPVKLIKALEILRETGHAVGEPTVSVAGGIIVQVDDKTVNEGEIFKLAGLPT